MFWAKDRLIVERNALCFDSSAFRKGLHWMRGVDTFITGYLLNVLRRRNSNYFHVNILAAELECLVPHFYLLVLKFTLWYCRLSSSSIETIVSLSKALVIDK